MEKDWYKRMAFYQIWIRSFYDGNGDGIGDLYGVYEKLPYIKSLGVDGIWFSPLYPSPNADYGYDISDYKNIHPDYGDLEQFQKVLDKAHSLGLKVIMDLVVNHTSDEHPWFLESKKSRDNPYSDYYIWRDGKNGKLPNNWDSLFEGKAWEYCPERDQYYLHIFAKKQPDLNMDNPKVREEVKSIMRFWLDRGVDGFREDVITFISKADNLPDGLPFIPAANGLPFYKDGPHIHEYLAEFRKVCEEYDCFQLGEGPMTSTRSALSYLTGKHKSLDLMFHFDHMFADCIFTEYMQRPFHLRSLKHAFSKWQKALNGRAWNTLYLENHDHPRVISRYGNERYHRASGSMLAVCYLFQQGTPFVYQGQEIGMENVEFQSISEVDDISTLDEYQVALDAGLTPDAALKAVNRVSRDNARTPFQWDSSANAGFTTGTPWLPANRNYTEINLASQKDDPDSVYQYYRRLLALRKDPSYAETIVYGDLIPVFEDQDRVMAYYRKSADQTLLVIGNYKTQPQTLTLPEGFKKVLLNNLPQLKAEGHEITLEGYQAVILEV